MRLSKDKSALVVNESLTLDGFPPECLRLSPGQPQRAGMGDRPVPGHHRQAQRHHQRPQPARRPRVHRPFGRPRGKRQRRDGRTDPRAAGLGSSNGLAQKQAACALWCFGFEWSATQRKSRNYPIYLRRAKPPHPRFSAFCPSAPLRFKNSFSKSQNRLSHSQSHHGRSSPRRRTW